MPRVAVVDYELCQPSRCDAPCVRFCPVNKTRPYKAIELAAERKGKPIIHEDKCIACGICVKKCPFKAIRVVNLPEEVEERLVHRFGVNAFKLYGLPTPIEGSIVGVVGPNGAGKTTAMRILSGGLVPNFGRLEGGASREAVLERFRGTQLYDYFRRLYEGSLRVVHKVQYVEYIPSYVKGVVREVLRRVDERGLFREVVEGLEMGALLGKEVSQLSGGELQKLAVSAALLRDADVYIFDEPTAFLDIRERLRVMRLLSELLPTKAYAFVVDHDLMFLDYVAHYVAVAFGVAGVYGMFSKPYPAKAGIDHYLRGFLPAENMRVRDEAVTFRLHESREDLSRFEDVMASWGTLRKRLNGFELQVEGGAVHRGEVIGVVGPNATGKTTFIRMLAGELQPDEGYVTTTAYALRYKPQYLSREAPCITVRECLEKADKSALSEENWKHAEIVRRLGVDRILEKEVAHLSGGELQKFYVAYTLVQDADIYLLDEPSSHIDAEDQLAVARAVKRVARLRKAGVFVVDHNLLMIDYAVDRLMVFTGAPGRSGRGLAPAPVAKALNEFLREVDVTIRRDPESGRPRVNKPGSYLDRYQKSLGHYFYSE